MQGPNPAGCLGFPSIAPDISFVSALKYHEQRLGIAWCAPTWCAPSDAVPSAGDDNLDPGFSSILNVNLDWNVVSIPRHLCTTLFGVLVRVAAGVEATDHGITVETRLAYGGDMTALGQDERDVLVVKLQQAFSKISPKEDMAASLLGAIPQIITMVATGKGCEELELRCYESKLFRSKLLLLVSVAKQYLIRRELMALEESLSTATSTLCRVPSPLLFDRLAEIQSRIVSWKRPFSELLTCPTLDEATSRSACLNGYRGISENLRWQ
ncbi:hypothetical protein HGO34_15205 [Agrobacterium vitis]|uniref:Uncharacterized protein n=1 Tax=Agrobacterium vitis TaxID=373 RepID=A0AAE4WEI8_AGRVI|nr:hypothetical protein [Agrobacterium vitis]MCF1499027.1 hypothetical protein [Allorhizobium sp. Av2]MCM2441067.1 hypothetical protein [Agrobacterium vitis]MUZ58475.1 hypothetical protein [Agrobacterium vitis]MVA65831.1 hypothetical protein [Agrobacterium vitis]MVA88147.1 hypothetical protein [Agrobacterium vitis]